MWNLENRKVSYGWNFNDIINFDEYMIDHRSYTHNLSSCEIKA